MLCFLTQSIISEGTSHQFVLLLVILFYHYIKDVFTRCLHCKGVFVINKYSLERDLEIVNILFPNIVCPNSVSMLWWWFFCDSCKIRLLTLRQFQIIFFFLLDFEVVIVSDLGKILCRLYYFYFFYFCFWI